MPTLYWILIALLVVIIATYFLGPKPPDPTYTLQLPEIPTQAGALQNYIEQQEAQVPVREDNQARVIWRHDDRRATEYSLVYLHGFAGSYQDGYPVNVRVADTLGANLYLARWAGHGLRPPASLDRFSPEAAWESAKEALAIGQAIGKKVILMSTSTGGTLAIKLAAEFPDQVHAIINMGPNIEDDQPGTFLLDSRWGYEIAQLVSLGSHRKIKHEQPIAEQYWDTIYPARALVDLEVLLRTTMLPETYQQVKCPVLTLYYHKNEFEEDQHVEVSVYPEVHEQFSTPVTQVRLVPLPGPGTHFIGSEIKSKDVAAVEREILNFCQTVLGIAF